MKRITDKQRLDALIALWDAGSTDFAQELFFARRKRKTARGASRLALNHWIRNLT